MIAFLSQSYSFSQKLVVIILIVIVVGICNTMISDILTDLITTLILGLAIPRILNILELLNQMEEFVKLFFFFLLCNNSHNPINIFCINFKGKKTVLCGLVILGVTTSRFFTCGILTRLKSYSWRQAWANGLMMTTLGVIEMSVFAIIKHEKVNLLNTTSKQVDHLY